MKTKISLILLAATLTACANVKQISKDVDAAHARSLALLNNGSQGVPEDGRRIPPLERVDGLWLPAHKVAPAAVKAELNPALLKRITTNRSFNSLQDVSSRITMLTGVPVIISPEATLPVTGAAGVAGLNSMSAGASPMTSGATMPIVPAIGGGSTSTGMAGYTGQIQPDNTIVYDGQLVGFLDIAASRYGVYWEWDNNGVRFFRTMTRTFRIAALPGDTTLSAKIGNQSSGSNGSSGTGSSSSSNGSGGTSTQETGVSFSALSVWKGIEDSIKTMLSTNGKVIVTAATGTVTVSDTPQVVAQVEKYIQDQNLSLGRQVVINVRVLSVDLTNSDSYGINWNAVYSTISGTYGFSFLSGFTPETGSTQLGLKILGTAGSATSNGIDGFAGSNAMINALSKQGRVNQLTSASVTTLNNQPAPTQVGRQVSYLQSSTTTLGSVGVQPTTTLQPGTITTGFSMNIVPHILDNNKLLLQYAIDLSSLLKLDSISSNGSTIQIPDIATRNFLQRVRINSGDTLVVTGFEQNTDTGNTQGLGDPYNVALGGGLLGSKSRSVLVVLIQPVVTSQ